jgi:hypothetical protein
VGDPGDLRAEPFDVLRLGRQEALGYEQRQVDVLVARLLDPPVERVARVLPQREAIRADDDAAPDGRIGRELGVADDVEIPLAEVGRSGCAGTVGRTGIGRLLESGRSWTTALAGSAVPTLFG